MQNDIIGSILDTSSPQPHDKQDVRRRQCLVLILVFTLTPLSLVKATT